MFKSILSFSELSSDDDQDAMKNRFTRAWLHLLKRLSFSLPAAVLLKSTGRETWTNLNLAWDELLGVKSKRM